MTAIASSLSFLAGILTWLVPNHYLPWTAFYNEFLSFVSLTILSLGLAFSATTCQVPRTALIAFSSILLFLALQIWIDPSNTSAPVTFLAAAYLSSFFLAYFIGLQAPHVKFPVVTPLALSVVVASIISVGLALHQWLELPLGIWLMDMRPGGRPYANLAQPNNLATLLLMGLASLIFLHARGTIGRIAFWTGTIFLTTGITLTQSRTAVLGLVLLTGWSIAGRKRCEMPISPAQISGAVVIFTASLLFFPWAQDALLLAGGSIVDRGTTSPARLTLWLQTLDAIARAPLTGYGWHQVGPALVEIAHEYDQMLYAEYSHNLFLDFLIWNGIPVGLLLIATLLWWGSTNVLRCRDQVTWLGVAVICVVGVHSMFELPHAYAYFLIPVGLMAGIVDRERSSKQIVFSSKWLITPALTGGILLGTVFVEYRIIEEAHREMRFEAARIGSPNSNQSLASIRLLSHLADFVNFARTQATEGLTENELAQMREIVRKNAHPPALFRYALALGLNHRYEDASLELRRLRALHGAEMFAEAHSGWASIAAHHPQLLSVKWPDH